MDAQEYIDQMARKRGSVLDFHSIMAKHDFSTLVAADDLTRATVLAERSLDARTKELAFIVCLAAIDGDPADLAHHVHIAQGMGISSQEILETLEILLPLAGVVAFKKAFTVWAEATGVDGLKPSVEATG